MLVLKPGVSVCTGETSHFSIHTLALLVQRMTCFQPLLQSCHRKGKEIEVAASGANAVYDPSEARQKPSAPALCFVLNGNKVLVGSLFNLLYVSSSSDSGQLTV